MSRKPTARVSVRDTDAAPAAGDETAPAKAPSAANTPTSQLIAMAKQSYKLAPLSNGKVITLSKPSALAQFRLVKVLGASASNQAYMQMVLPLIYVTEIDDADGEGPKAVPFPNTEREVEALIVRLDEEGVAAVALGVMKYYSGVVLDGANPRQMTVDEMMEAQKEAVKKS